MKEKGFVPLVILLVVVLGAIVAGAIGYFQLKPKLSPPSTKQISQPGVVETNNRKVYKNSDFEYTTLAFKKNKTLYEITAFTPTTAREDTFKVFNKMISTFKFLD